MKYEQQLELHLQVTRDATPKECQEWFEQELKPQADIQFKVILLATIMQVVSSVSYTHLRANET